MDLNILQSQVLRCRAAVCSELGARTRDKTKKISYCGDDGVHIQINMIAIASVSRATPSVIVYVPANGL
jgi:hypothetical protein